MYSKYTDIRDLHMSDIIAISFVMSAQRDTREHPKASKNVRFDIDESCQST